MKNQLWLKKNQSCMSKKNHEQAKKIVKNKSASNDQYKSANEEQKSTLIKSRTKGKRKKNWGKTNIHLTKGLNNQLFLLKVSTLVDHNFARKMISKSLVQQLGLKTLCLSSSTHLGLVDQRHQYASDKNVSSDFLLFPGILMKTNVMLCH